MAFSTASMGWPRPPARLASRDSLRRAAGLIGIVLMAPAAAAEPPVAPMLQAQLAEALKPATPAPGLTLALGLGPYLYPRYLGARTYRLLPFPYLEGGYGEWLSFELFDGLRLPLLRGGGFSAGPMGRYRWGRSSSESLAQLQGLREINDTIELGGFVSVTNGPLWLDLTATQDVLHGGHGGLVIEATATLSLPVAKTFGVEAGPFLRGGSGAYLGSYFGINAAQSAVNGKPAYAAHAGLERAGLQLLVQWDLAETLSLRSQTEIGQLLASAAQSPVTRQGGAALQVYSGLFLVWQFR